MTLLFSDYLEKGDFSKWTSTWETETGASISVTPEIAYRGAYCIKHVAEASSGYLGSGARKTLTLPSTVYARVYVRFTALPISGKKIEYLLDVQDGDTDIFWFNIYNEAGTLKWQVGTKDAGAVVYATSATPEILVDKWYLAEMKCVQAVDGSVALYINEIKVAELTGKNTITGVGIINLITTGINISAPDKEYVVYKDVIKVSDEYIGDEPVKCMKLVKNPCSSL